MSAQESTRRDSARVLLIDELDRLLLLKFHMDPEAPEHGHGWCTPGGGVEEGETLAQAAARELREETGLSVAPGALGPVVAETSGYADVGWAEGIFRDVFFHLRVTTHQVDVTGQEANESKYHAGYRWWPLADLAATSETVYPFGLAHLTAELATGHTPADPIHLPWHH
ncbi:NUDIX hydrolase [Streptomyces sp. NPDC020965]|uniref:NUDIX hydrolase n=1 Tax=Streptomyces sp. NPDC020965 TaxID=3365105 RepID=UPI0037A399C6